MNKVLSSPITKIIALIIGYLAALSVVRAISFPFNYYVREIIGNWMKMELFVALPLFVACAAFLFVAVWQAKSGRIPPPWRNVDFSLLVVLTYCVVLLCTYLAWHNEVLRISDYNYNSYNSTYGNRTYLLVLTVAAYLMFMVLLIETAARLRDKHLVRTLSWLRFFRIYSIRQPIGLLMALLLAGALLYLLVLCPFDALAGRLNIVALALSVFWLAVLTYFCSFILSLSREYDRANAEKIRAERFKAELITNVSHDIRTPLTAIINYVDLLKDLPVENEQFTEYVGILNKKTARLKTLISDLMEASKAGTGNLSVDLQEIVLGEIVGQVAGEFDDSFSERGLTFVFRQPEEPVLTRADSGHLYRALENLFSNAVKYALPGTRVFAEIAVSEGRPMFSLKNTSQNPIDMPGDTLTEQFIRGDRARHTEGSGLGLYIAKSLVELMGGRLSIRVTGDLFEASIMMG